MRCAKKSIKTSFTIFFQIGTNSFAQKSRYFSRYCDSPAVAVGLICRKIRTTIQGPEMRQMIGGFSSPSNSKGPTEKGQSS